MGTHISFPLFIPFIIFISMIIGAPIVGEKNHFAYDRLDLAFAKSHLLQYVIGSFILAVFASLTIGFLTYFFLQKFKPKPQN